MAAKITAQDIDDAGFKPAQFGMASASPNNWAEPTAAKPYIDRLLGRVEAWARGRFTGDYDATATTTLTGERLRAAELCWASAQLWKRRAAFIDANAVSSMDNLAYLDRREFEAQATRAFECADDNLALANGGEDNIAGTGAALAAAESGPFAQGGLPCACG